MASRKFVPTTGIAPWQTKKRESMQQMICNTLVPKKRKTKNKKNQKKEKLVA